MKTTTLRITLVAAFASAANGYVYGQANQPPWLEGIEGTALEYTENGGAVLITSTITVSDVDNTSLQSATVQITGHYTNGQDVLSFTNQNGITGSWSAATGVLTLTGSATVANYQTALRSVKYQNTGEDPSTATRTISFAVNDGMANSNTLTRDITVIAVNDAPVEAGIEGTMLVYTENDGAVPITSTITVSDVDNTSLQSATVQITGHYTNGQDVLSFTNQNGITGSWSAATGVLTLTGTATVANYQTALRSVKYQNTSENPSTATRTISFAVNDGMANSNTLTRDVVLIAVNDAPVEAGIEGTMLVYAENAGAVPITSTVTVSDVDSTSLQSATVLITGNYANGQDVLSFTNQNGIIGSWSSVTGVLTLTGSATAANYQTALRSVKYQNTSEDPSTATRTISFTVNDGMANSNMLSRSVAITPVNDAPVEAGIEGTMLVYAENAGAVPITSTVTVSDVDSTSLQSATVQITGNYANGQDVLSFTNQNGIIGSWSSVTGVLTLTGTATVANYQTALRSVRYQNTSEDPSTATRTISFTVSDGMANSNMLSRSVAITPVNDAPVEAGIEGTMLVYAENAGAVPITSTVTVSDVDNTSLQSATVQITGNYANGQDVLSFTNQNGIIGSWSSVTGVLTLTGIATAANYQTALRSVKYQNTSENPSPAIRTISFTVSDGWANSNMLSRTVVITPVNDAPVAECRDVKVPADAGGVASASIDGGSYDPDGDPITMVQDPPGPYPIGITVVTLTVSDSAGAWSSCTASVTVFKVTRGDLDRDTDVDGFDFLTFANCYNGSDRAPLEACENLEANLDGDEDVDGFDFLTFANCYNGSDRVPLCE